MASIRTLLRRLTGRPDPSLPDVGRRIQEDEQAAAVQRLLRASRAEDPGRSAR